MSFWHNGIYIGLVYNCLCRKMVEDIRQLKQLSLDEESVDEDVSRSAK